MKIVTGPRPMNRLIRCRKQAGESIGFVATMGALHAGHVSLIRRARRENDLVVVSIFVNPLQFAPSEDFSGYPRPRSEDIKICRREHVDIVFSPSAGSFYPRGFCSSVKVEGGLSSVMCGLRRPGHFQGVATVVMKLFNVIQPDRAYFGQKDAQQAVIIRRMVEDFNLPVAVKVLPIVRESDGLALSSRNRYLTASERKKAVVLYKSLRLAYTMIMRSKLRSSTAVITAMRRFIKRTQGVSLEYIAVVDARGLKPLKKLKGECLIALAARIGTTRLIDNIIVAVK